MKKVVFIILILSFLIISISLSGCKREDMPVQNIAIQTPSSIKPLETIPQPLVSIPAKEPLEVTSQPIVPEPTEELLETEVEEIPEPETEPEILLQPEPSEEPYLPTISVTEELINNLIGDNHYALFYKIYYVEKNENEGYAAFCYLLLSGDGVVKYIPTLSLNDLHKTRENISLQIIYDILWLQEGVTSYGLFEGTYQLIEDNIVFSVIHDWYNELSLNFTCQLQPSGKLLYSSPDENSLPGEHIPYSYAGSVRYGDIFFDDKADADIVFWSNYPWEWNPQLENLFWR